MSNPKASNMFCWWCGGDLSEVAHAVIYDQMDRPVKVHKCCEKDATKFMKPVTADVTPVLCRYSHEHMSVDGDDRCAY